MSITLELEYDHPPKMLCEYSSRGGKYRMSLSVVDTPSPVTEEATPEYRSVVRERYNQRQADATWVEYLREKKIAHDIRNPPKPARVLKTKVDLTDEEKSVRRKANSQKAIAARWKKQ